MACDDIMMCCAPSVSCVPETESFHRILTTNHLGQECVARFNGEDADEDKNIVKFGALIYVLGKTYSAGFETELCNEGNPCLAKVSDDPELLKAGTCLNDLC